MFLISKTNDLILTQQTTWIEIWFKSLVLLCMVCVHTRIKNWWLKSWEGLNCTAIEQVTCNMVTSRLLLHRSWIVRLNNSVCVSWLESGRDFPFRLRTIPIMPQPIQAIITKYFSNSILSVFWVCLQTVLFINKPNREFSDITLNFFNLKWPLLFITFFYGARYSKAHIQVLILGRRVVLSGVPIQMVVLGLYIYRERERHCSGRPVGVWNDLNLQ